MRQVIYRKAVTIFKQEDVGKVYMYEENSRLIPLRLKDYGDELLFENTLDENKTYTLEDLCIKGLDQILVIEEK